MQFGEFYNSNTSFKLIGMQILKHFIGRFLFIIIKDNLEFTKSIAESYQLITQISYRQKPSAQDNYKQHLIEINKNLTNLMSQDYPSQVQRQHEFFLTLKRYAERLNDQKNVSLSYLQTINKLSQQLTEKDSIIQNLTRQNQQLRQKLSLYEQVMTRSRIMINNGGTKSSQNTNVTANLRVSKNIKPVSPSATNNYASMKFCKLMGRQKFAESFMQTRNELQYLKEYDQEAYQKLQSKVKAQKQSRFVENNVYGNVKEDTIMESGMQKYRVFPVFDDFIILKPTQNADSSPSNITDMKLVFSLSNQPIKKGNKLFESISTYLCHNSGPSWVAEEYKTQVEVTKSSLNNNSLNGDSKVKNTSLTQNSSTESDQVFIYLSNSQQTLQPISYFSNSQQPISPIYLQFNPSLYYFGICYKSHCLEYINGKLHKVPVLYCFVTRYPFLCFWRELLELIVERLNIKNQRDMTMFRDQLQKMREKSLHKTEGVIIHREEGNINEGSRNINFQFSLLQQQVTWKKITFIPKGDSPKQQSATTMIIPISQNYQAKSSPLIYPNFSFQYQTAIPEIVLYQLAPIFSSYNMELIIDVLLLLLLEIPIAVISKNQALLQKFMIYFVYIIKPLKYPFPIIFNLPLNMTVVLQSPFPSFLGVTDHQILEPYMFERTVFDLDEKVAKSWPNIDFYNQSRECVVKWVNMTVENEMNGIKKLQKINEIVKILITSSKKYPQELKELRTYRKYFKKTQIWHLFNNSQEQANGKN